MTIDEELSVLDDHVRRLKVEYDVFFGGGAKKPPAELDWKVKNLFKKLDGTRMNFSQRFRYNSIQQRFARYSVLWQQKLQIREEGYRRPQDAVLGIQGLRDEQQHSAELARKHLAVAQKDAAFSIACSDLDSEGTKVEALFRALSDARRQTGEKNSANLASFTKFVRQKTEQLRKEYDCHAVEYSVELQDGQVKLKAKPKT